MEKELNEKESLAIISNMIASTRQKLSENSVHYLLWGWSVLLAATIHYILMQFNYSQAYLSWLLMPVTGVVAILFGRKQHLTATVRTHIDQAMTYLWLGLVVMILLSLFAASQIGFQNVYPLLIWLYGLGTFVSGGLLKFRPLLWGGVASWIIGTFALFVPFEQQLLLLALSIVTSYIIPGHLLAGSKA